MTSYRRFGTTNKSNLEESSSSNCLNREVRIGCPEISDTDYKSTLCKILDQRRSLYIMGVGLGGGGVKSFLKFRS
jgi:hypothetical protein